MNYCSSKVSHCGWAWVGLLTCSSHLKRTCADFTLMLITFLVRYSMLQVPLVTLGLYYSSALTLKLHAGYTCRISQGIKCCYTLPSLTGFLWGLVASLHETVNYCILHFCESRTKIGKEPGFFESWPLHAQELTLAKQNPRWWPFSGRAPL